MIGSVMTGARWTYALARFPSRVVHRLSDWAWWAFDDSGKPMPKKARRAAGAATLILAVAAVVASAMHWVEPERAAILWGWFSILAIAGSAFQASRQLARKHAPAKSAAKSACSANPANPGVRRPLRERVRAVPRDAALAMSAAARRTCTRVRQAAPGHAANAWTFSCRAGKATCRSAASAGRSLASSVSRASNRKAANRASNGASNRATPGSSNAA